MTTPYFSVRVLVVDCDRDAAEILGILLQAHGFEIKVECGKKAALEAAETFSPAAVLIDLGHSNADTYELAASIRSNPKLANVFLVTLAANVATPLDARDFHIDLQLTKPTGYRVLVDALNTKFGR